NPGALNPEVPGELVQIINRALEKDRDMRSQSAAELKAQLRHLKRETESGPSVATPAPVRGGNKRTLALAAVLALAVVVVVAGYFYSHRQSSGTIDSIAVLPFAGEGTTADSEYLSDGITDGIINSLSRLRQLQVRAHSTVTRYKGKDQDPE